MSDKQNYWISDANGVYALVEGAEQRDLWTRVRGWALAEEPLPTDQVHVVNEHPEVGAGRLPYAAIPGWAGLGWSAGPPPEPVDTIKDPAGTDVPVPVVEQPKSTKSAAAASGDQKEK